MRELISLLEEKSKQEKIEIIKTPYSLDDLSPVMSEDLLKLHYSKLAHGYADRYNKGEGDPDFNYAGVFLHNLLFIQYRSSKNKNIPTGNILNFINKKYENWDNFKEKFIEESMKLQGSGWIYLSKNGSIKTIHNHQVRKDILILVDMWEHAFQLDYSSDKKKYLENIWKIINWDVINTRLDE